ncbi:hypothetical protein [Gordonia hirsuta]|nr:hypothetical protein [Gordonia hirsuta]
MAYLYLLIILVAVGFVVWKISQAPKNPPAPTSRRDAPRGPDDDPEFLRRL